ncbi:MAG: DNA recombination protein RmuC [Candidatus Omnitrophica bacterium]|nr:DNA recombination protein RmuC [Candidatus Omnitrophota bacterium]MCK5259824.1 DNA recombination protein RmuC [Candidatus Omnitrophota bacterium]
MSTLIISLLVVNTILLALLLLRYAQSGFASIKDQFGSIEKNQERTERIVREDISKNREELRTSLSSFSETNEKKLENVREVVERQLRLLQEDNSQKLEKMRETVDEKLHSTLEKRLGESFQAVSERLEKVHQGLGEMQTLASGVGDLKKVLTNVKTRGTWGEIQLGNLLEQILTSNQYERNIPTKKGSNDPVEFAIKLPGREGEEVYIPIDAKFPKEDYERLLQAQDEGDVSSVEESGKAIESRIKLEAKKIRDKYIDPPHTTDFAILYLPIEGLYAEVLRRPGLFDQVQREFRVTISGPTTITAVLNALQMGFRTLAVEKRASEVWILLGVVKTEFGKFGTILEKTHEKIKQAGDNIEAAARKSRTIERKLRKVEELPATKETVLIENNGIDGILNPNDDGSVQ